MESTYEASASSDSTSSNQIHLKIPPLPTIREKVSPIIYLKKPSDRLTFPTPISNQKPLENFVEELIRNGFADDLDHLPLPRHDRTNWTLSRIEKYFREPMKTLRSKLSHRKAYPLGNQLELILALYA